MLIIALVGNCVIGLMCLFVAWRLWRLKRQFARIADTLITVEQKVHQVLYPAPRFIYMGQKGSHSLRLQLQQLEPQVQRAQQVIGLMNLGRRLWFRGVPGARRLQRGRRRL